jgi:hypothetical protein
MDVLGYVRHVDVLSLAGSGDWAAIVIRRA